LIIGLAYVRFYNRTWPVDLTALGGSSLLVILGLGFRGWPFATRIVANGQRQLAREWREAAILGNSDSISRRLWVTIPMTADHIAAGWLIAFVLAAGEVEVSQMLCAPGQGTLALRMFTYLHFGPEYVVASLAVLQFAITAIPVFLYLSLFNCSSDRLRV
jgi:ABC-type Fe3+ transport system permease subunit